MRDFIGLMFIILAGALVTKHFALGVLPFLFGAWLMAGKGSAASADGAALFPLRVGANLYLQ